MQVHRPLLGEIHPGEVSWLDSEIPATWEPSAKPFFLFFTSRRSFWSRAMVQESFTDAEIVREIEALTWPVWIDADLRPDLVDQFSLGSLPSLAILTPDMRWVTGTTYMDREDVSALLRRIRILYDIPERQVDLERERTRLLIRRPYQFGHFAQSMEPEELSKTLIDRLRRSDVYARSFDSQILLADAGFEDQTQEWLDVQADRRLLNDQGLFVNALLTDDGLIRDEVASLGHNAGLLYAMSWFADKNNDTNLKVRAYKLAQALIAVLYDQERGTFFAGTADFSFPDSTGVPHQVTANPALLDGRTVTAWNALMVSSLLQVARFRSDDPRFGGVISATLDHLVADCVSDDIVYRTDSRKNTPTLEDAGFLVRACLDYSEWSGDMNYKRRAGELSTRAIGEFLPDSNYTELAGNLDSGGLNVDPVGTDGDYGSATGTFAHSLVRLSQLSGNDAFLDQALKINRRAIFNDIERLPRLGAVGRALLEYVRYQRTRN